MQAAPLLLLLVLKMTSAAGDVSTRYDESTGRIVVSVQRGDAPVDVEHISVSGPPRPCDGAGPTQNCFQLQAVGARSGSAGVCYRFSASYDIPGITVGNCIPHNGSHVYGGPEQYHQEWPIESRVYDFYPYVTSQQDNMAVAERYWLFSDGRYVHSEANVPLFIDQNVAGSEGWLCLNAKKAAPYSLERPGIVVNKTTCVFPDARSAHEDAVQRFLGRPSAAPDGRLVTLPIWSTAARHGADVDDARVRQLASQVAARGFGGGLIEVDGRWETCYGSLALDAAKFPDVRGLTRDLHDLGFGVALWVHPFVNLDCEPHHSEGLAKGYFVSSTDGHTNTSWWNGEASVIDFTNPEAADWWAGRLWTLLNETGIDSFRVDAGETSWLPQLPHIEPVELSPAQFTRDFLTTAAQFGAATQVGVAERSQQMAALVRMRGKDSRWGLDGGLASLVTTLLQLNVAGYPFVLPDTVGGHGVPSKQLFVRWLQATVFMPAVHFSHVPWDFDDETVEISRQLTALHARYAPRIIQLMQKAVEDGSPVNPPIWWLDPTDQVALTINSEFLLGEDLLVAPVLEEGAVSRDVYLPRGRWRDEMDPQHPLYQGPVWLYDYPAPLSVLPYFTRASDIPEPPAPGGAASRLRLFVPATVSSWVANTVLFYICSIILQQLLT